MYSQNLHHHYGRQQNDSTGSDPQGYQTRGQNISTPNSESARRIHQQSPIPNNRPPLPSSADRRGMIYNSFTSTYLGSSSSDSNRDPPPTVSSDASRTRRVIFSKQLEIHEKQRAQNCSTPTIPILRTGSRASKTMVPSPRSESRAQARSCRDPTPRAGERGHLFSGKRKTINDILDELSKSESVPPQGASSDPPLDRSRRSLYSPAAKSPRDIFSKIALRERSANQLEKEARNAEKRKSMEPEAVVCKPLLQSTTDNNGVSNHSWDISDLFPEKSVSTTPIRKQRNHESQVPFDTSVQISQNASPLLSSNMRPSEPCNDHWDTPDVYSDPWNHYLHDRSPSNSSTESQEAILIRKGGRKVAMGRALDKGQDDGSSIDNDYIPPQEDTPPRSAGAYRLGRPKENSEVKRNTAQKERTRYAQLDEDGEVGSYGTELVLISHTSERKKQKDKINTPMRSTPASNRKILGSLLKRGTNFPEKHVPFQELPVQAMSFDESVDLKKDTDDTSDSDSGVYRTSKARRWDIFDREADDSRFGDDESLMPYYGDKLRNKWRIVFMLVCLVIFCLSIGIPVYNNLVVKEDVPIETTAPPGTEVCVQSSPDTDSFSTRYIEIRKVVIAKSFGDDMSVDEPGSAQRKALCWLSDSDKNIEQIDAGTIPAIIQRYTMALLYFSLVVDDEDSEQSLKGTDFLTSSHECEWGVVMCGTPKTVTALLLADKVLRGSLPSEIANLGSLEYLELSLNYLSGTIPTSIEHLTLLEYFAIAFNSFSGSIPTQLGSLTRLEFLNMRSSQVSGKIPTELGQLGKLETILLEGNWLSGTIPPELGNLFNAEQMTFQKNYLTGKVSGELCELREMALTELTVDSWIECDCCTL